MNTDKDTPKPTKQQRNLFLGLLKKLIELYDQEGEYFWKEYPWMEDRTYPKPWGLVKNPEWDLERRVLRKKIMRIHDELDKLFEEMYPPHLYPEMHGAIEQPALIDGAEPQLYNAPKEEPRAVEDMSMEELEGIFGARKSPPPIVAKTTAGAEILKQFEVRRSRNKKY